jgi:hypothetical protein
MRSVLALLTDWPLLSLGLVTFGLFLAVEAFTESLAFLIPTLRVLIVPLWAMRTLEMVLGIGNWPGALQFLVALPLLFLPYVAADLLLQCGKKHRSARHAVNVSADG